MGNFHFYFFIFMIFLSQEEFKTSLGVGIIKSEVLVFLDFIILTLSIHVKFNFDISDYKISSA